MMQTCISSASPILKAGPKHVTNIIQGIWANAARFAKGLCWIVLLVAVDGIMVFILAPRTSIMEFLFGPEVLIFAGLCLSILFFLLIYWAMRDAYQYCRLEEERVVLFWKQLPVREKSIRSSWLQTFVATADGNGFLIYLKNGTGIMGLASVFVFAKKNTHDVAECLNLLKARYSSLNVIAVEKFSRVPSIKLQK